MHQGLRMRGLEFYKGEVDKYQREYEVRLILLLHRHFKLHYKIIYTLGRENIHHKKKGMTAFIVAQIMKTMKRK